MMWKISKDIYDKEDFADDGNRFLIGNGYIGVRGTLDEYKKDHLVAVNLAGIYDKVENLWREPLNAPNPFYSYVVIDKREYTCPEITPYKHHQELDFRCGTFKRNTKWKNDKGIIEVRSERFVSMDNVHIFGYEFSLKCDFNCDTFIYTGIDKDVWDINGPHYKDIECKVEDDIIYSTAYAKNSAVMVSRKDFFSGSYELCEVKNCVKKIKLSLKAQDEFIIRSIGTIFTTKDSDDLKESSFKLLSGFHKESYEIKKHKSKDRWQSLWDICEIEIKGDDIANKAMNYSIYHLNSIAPRHSKDLSIAARGLSGQVYKGAIFWDTEMFMLDFYLYTQPEVARSLVSYRIKTLKGAIEKAKEYGYEGAFYAWESQDYGFDACSDFNVVDVFTKRPVRTYFRDKQVHISAAVVYGIMKYFDYTLDYDILIDGGANTIINCAKFYLSILLKPFNKEHYEIRDVVGPDEYHERVNNNAYTNKMAEYTFKSALRVIELLKTKYPTVYDELNKVENLEKLTFDLNTEVIYIPCPDENHIIEQFDGYFKLEDASLGDLRKRLKDNREYWGGSNGVASQTKVIKQADVVLMLEIFHKEYDKKILKENFEYYEKYTEHGSSLSACMYGLLACRFDEPDRAYPFFLRSAKTDIDGGGKQWAGLIYIGGTHPASSGGAFKILTQGFLGLHFKDSKPHFKPCLPSHWEMVSFKFIYLNKIYKATITKQEVHLKEIYLY